VHDGCPYLEIRNQQCKGR